MKEVKVTDGFFAKVITDISANSTLFFTPKQFLYFLDKKLKKKSFNFGGMITVYIFLSIWTTLFFGGIISSLLRLGFIAFPIVLFVYNLLCIFYLFSLSNSTKSNYHTRQHAATALQILGAIAIVGGSIFSIANKSGIAYLLTMLIGLPAIWLGLLQKRRIAKISNSFVIERRQMENWLDMWGRINGKLAQLLPTPNLAQPTEGEQTSLTPDVTAYSFDRLVVCNNSEVAQMLIANNFHFENNCAILSITGYPQVIFKTVLEMLRRNQNLIVYAFHDASPQGVRLSHQLRTSGSWFRDSDIKIIDLGLAPRQVMANPRHLFVGRSNDMAAAAKHLEPEVVQNLTKAELAWLEAGNFVELESFSPQQLIRILNRGIANTQQIDDTDSGLIIWVDNSGSVVYGTESFG
jgi:hypothetical protein